MKFNKQSIEYIDGSKFSSTFEVSFANEKLKEQTRIEKVIELTKNKKIIHIGCADHLPLIQQKIASGKWLHGLLTQQASTCIGIDINEQAIDFIKTELKYSNVYTYADIAANQEIITSQKWDYMVLGEIIEHVDNPVAFLSDLKEKYKDSVDKIIITAPNVFNLLTVNAIRKNKEAINSDHRYWFSPFTLSKVVHQAGYKNVEFYFTDRVKLPFIKAIIKRIKTWLGIPLKFEANCFATLVVVADF